MTHSCRALLCETPHFEEVHEHDWRGWNVYPECDGCLRDLAQYIHEETDFIGCPIPELCEYAPACDAQWRKERVA